jgi:hypothetical protein
MGCGSLREKQRRSQQGHSQQNDPECHGDFRPRRTLWRSAIVTQASRIVVEENALLFALSPKFHKKDEGDSQVWRDIQCGG